MLWTKSMESGIPLVDAQHKALFHQVDLLLSSENQDRVIRIIQFLERYVVEHFSTEEAMHAKTGYPKASAHKKLHDDFTANFIALKREYGQSGYNLKTLLKINHSVVAWLREHVLGADMEFARYQEKCAGLQPA